MMGVGKLVLFLIMLFRLIVMLVLVVRVLVVLKCSVFSSCGLVVGGVVLISLLFSVLYID